MSAIAGWPEHEIAGEGPLEVGTLVYVLPGRAKRQWRARVARDMPGTGLCAVIADEPGKGWTFEVITVNRALVKRRTAGER